MVDFLIWVGIETGATLGYATGYRDLLGQYCKTDNFVVEFVDRKKNKVSSLTFQVTKRKCFVCVIKVEQKRRKMFTVSIICHLLVPSKKERKITTRQSDMTIQIQINLYWPNQKLFRANPPLNLLGKTKDKHNKIILCIKYFWDFLSFLTDFLIKFSSRHETWLPLVWLQKARWTHKDMSLKHQIVWILYFQWNQ